MPDERNILRGNDGKEPTAEERRLEALLAQMPRRRCPSHVRDNVLASLRGQMESEAPPVEAPKVRVIALPFRRRVYRILEVAAVFALMAIGIKVYHDLRPRLRIEPAELAPGKTGAPAKEEAEVAGTEAKGYEVRETEKLHEPVKMAVDANGNEVGKAMPLARTNGRRVAGKGEEKGLVETPSAGTIPAVEKSGEIDLRKEGRKDVGGLGHGEVSGKLDALGKAVDAPAQLADGMVSGGDVRRGGPVGKSGVAQPKATPTAAPTLARATATPPSPGVPGASPAAPVAKPRDKSGLATAEAGAPAAPAPLPLATAAPLGETDSRDLAPKAAAAPKSGAGFAFIEQPAGETKAAADAKSAPMETAASGVEKRGIAKGRTAETESRPEEKTARYMEYSAPGGPEKPAAKASGTGGTAAGQGVAGGSGRAPTEEVLGAAKKEEPRASRAPAISPTAAKAPERYAIAGKGIDGEGILPPADLGKAKSEGQPAKQGQESSDFLFMNQFGQVRQTTEIAQQKTEYLVGQKAIGGPVTANDNVAGDFFLRRSNLSWVEIESSAPIQERIHARNTIDEIRDLPAPTLAPVAQQPDRETTWTLFVRNSVASFSELVSNFDATITDSQEIVVIPGERPAVMVECSLPASNRDVLLNTVNQKRMMAISNVENTPVRQGLLSEQVGEESITRQTSAPGLAGFQSMPQDRALNQQQRRRTSLQTYGRFEGGQNIGQNLFSVQRMKEDELANNRLPAISNFYVQTPPAKQADLYANQRRARNVQSWAHQTTGRMANMGAQQLAFDNGTTVAAALRLTPTTASALAVQQPARPIPTTRLYFVLEPDQLPAQVVPPAAQTRRE